MAPENSPAIYESVSTSISSAQVEQKRTHGSLVRARHGRPKRTSRADMRTRRHGKLALVKDLVVVSVQHPVRQALAKVVPRVDTPESVVDGDGNPTVLQVAPAVRVELVEHVRVDLWAHGLVQDLDASDSRVAGMVVTDLAHGGQGLIDRLSVRTTPGDGTALATVVETVLRARGTVKINEDLQTGGLSPVQSCREVLVGPLHVRVAVERGDGPVSDGAWVVSRRVSRDGKRDLHSHMVQASSGDAGKVVLSDEGAPVLLESGLGSILAKHLGQGELVDGRALLRIEERRGDPGLENKPAAEIDSSDFVAAVVELQRGISRGRCRLGADGEDGSAHESSNASVAQHH